MKLLVRSFEAVWELSATVSGSILRLNHGWLSQGVGWHAKLRLVPSTGTLKLDLTLY
jgi:hypothetical protein